MIRILRFLRESVKSLGTANGLLATLARSLDWVSGGRCRLFKYYFVAQPVPAHAKPGPGRTSKTRIYRVFAGDGIIEQFPRPPQNIAKRFADGAICYVAAQANRFVGFIWIKQDTYDEDEVKCHYVLQPAARLAWDFDAYVAPEFRMSRAFAQLWEAANEHLRERGYQWTISRISAFNANSLAAHKRLGIVHLHTGLFVVLGPLQFSGFTCAPYVHIAFGPSSTPDLILHAPAASSNP